MPRRVYDRSKLITWRARLTRNNSKNRSQLYEPRTVLDPIETSKPKKKMKESGLIVSHRSRLPSTAVSVPDPVNNIFIGRIMQQLNYARARVANWAEGAPEAGPLIYIITLGIPRCPRRRSLRYIFIARS